MGAILRTFPVGPDKGQDHGLLLSALEAINRLNLELGVLAGEALPEQIHLKQKAGLRSRRQVRDPITPPWAPFSDNSSKLCVPEACSLFLSLAWE